MDAVVPAWRSVIRADPAATCRLTTAERSQHGRHPEAVTASVLPGIAT
jgi:hypothetical protein